MEGSIAEKCMAGVFVLLVLALIIQTIRAIYRSIKAYFINESVVSFLRDACRECTDDSVDKAICVLNHVNLADLGRRKTFECCRASWKLLSAEQNISTAKKQELRRAILTSGVNL